MKTPQDSRAVTFIHSLAKHISTASKRERTDGSQTLKLLQEYDRYTVLVPCKDSARSPQLYCVLTVVVQIIGCLLSVASYEL